MPRYAPTLWQAAERFAATDALVKESRPLPLLEAATASSPRLI